MGLDECQVPSFFAHSTPRLDEHQVQAFILIWLYMVPNRFSLPFRNLLRSVAETLSPPCALLSFLLVSGLCFAQVPTRKQAAKPAAKDNMQQHYDAARTFQLGGNQDRAAAEYSTFLIEALRINAKARAGLGQRDKAAALFEDALRLAPQDPQTRLEYAELRFQQEKLVDARALAEKVLAAFPDNPQAHSLLGQILFAQADYKGAREHLELAVVATPGFDVGYLLGVTYIKLNDFERARLVFDDMVASFGDTANIHMMFGRAYKQGGWEALDNAVKELKIAIARDGRVQHAHFLLALAYIDRDGESGFPQAAPELQSELKVNPEDSRSHYLLGYIAMKQHDAKAAESDLLRASQLDAKNPDPLIYLGQIYSEADRDAEAEAMLRKALSLSSNSSPSDYLVGRAHYILGRVLLKTGRREEGERELAASQAIRDRMNRPDSTRDRNSKLDPELASVSQDGSVGRPPAAVEVPPQAREEMQAYLEQLKPAIADAYNNLGVIQAGRKEFVAASENFRKAGEWVPSLETLDRNWGMAAFYAKNYQEAVPPLTRQLQKQPDDVKVRAALGLSLFMGQNFNGTLDTLRPIQTEVDSDSGLDYAFAVSLVKTGDYEEGMRRLKALEEANPNSADIHTLLGSALADQHEYDRALDEYRKALAIDPSQAQTHYLEGLALIHAGHPKDAVEELRTALKLNPSDVSAKYHLAFSLIQIQQKEEAQALLRQVIQQDPNRADAYYEMGKLQLEQGDTKGAVQSLETGSKVSPDADYIHYQLAMAYRRESRSEDAEREIKLYQVLKDRQRGRGDVPQSN
jgi:tetratricopeptide (TPR) repeat protein